MRKAPEGKARLICLLSGAGFSQGHLLHKHLPWTCLCRAALPGGAAALTWLGRAWCAQTVQPPRAQDTEQR